MAYSRKDIIDAISQASQSSGVDFSYLVNQAAAESNFDPSAKAKTSSASGLYQFIDSTWLSMVDRYGDSYGIETQGKSKQEILNMRNDPETSSFMAAAFASENEKFLNTNWGGDIGATELYFAHFMGASGATSFLNARDENPMQNAADLFPRAARANRNVFYDSETGKSRSLEEVYSFFDKKFNSSDAANRQEILVAGTNVPIPPATPMEKLAAMARNENTANNLYSPSRSMSDNIIMQRAQAMREATQLRSSYAQSLYQNAERQNLLNDVQNEHSSIFKKTKEQNDSSFNESYQRNSLSTIKSPLDGLLAQPLDLMMLTQISTPGKVLNDKS